MVEHSDDKLHLLGHTFRELLDLLAPPVGDSELVEPGAELLLGLAAREPLQTGEKHRLLADFHLLVEAAFLGEIPYIRHVGLSELTPAEEHAPRIGSRDMVDDADKRRLARAVGAEKSVDLPFGHVDRHAVEGQMGGIRLAYVFYLQYVVHTQKGI